MEAVEPVNYANLERALGELLEELGESTTPQLLGMAGDDQMGPNPLLPELVKRASEVRPGVTAKISSLVEYMKAFRKACPPDLKVVKGEMRHSSMNGLMTDLYWGIVAAPFRCDQYYTVGSPGAINGC